MFRLPPLPNQLRGFESVEIGHIDIEQDHRKILDEQMPQCFPAGVGGDNLLRQALQNGLHRQEFLGDVVHHQDFDFLLGQHQRGPADLCLWVKRSNSRPRRDE